MKVLQIYFKVCYVSVCFSIPFNDLNMNGYYYTCSLMLGNVFTWYCCLGSSYLLDCTLTYIWTDNFRITKTRQKQILNTRPKHFLSYNLPVNDDPVVQALWTVVQHRVIHLRLPLQLRREEQRNRHPWNRRCTP